MQLTSSTLNLLTINVGNLWTSSATSHICTNWAKELLNVWEHYSVSKSLWSIGLVRVHALRCTRTQSQINKTYIQIKIRLIVRFNLRILLISHCRFQNHESFKAQIKTLELLRPVYFQLNSTLDL